MGPVDVERLPVARDTVIVGDQLLLPYVLADRAGAWHTVVRTARCPRG